MEPSDSGQAKTGSELLLDVGQRLFLERGYANVSMQLIAEEAGMTKGAPYYHFRSKEDLFFAVSVRILESLRSGFALVFAAEGSLEDRLRQGMLTILGSAAGDYSVWFSDVKYVIKPNVGHNLFRDLVGDGSGENDLWLLLEPSFSEAVARGEITRVTSEVAARVFLKLLVASINECGYQRQLGTLSEDDIRKTTDEVVDIFLHGVG